MPINRILTDDDRISLRHVIDRMYDLAPEMCLRKFYDALVQQAFVFDTTQALIPLLWQLDILSAGSYEDTAGEALKKIGYSVHDVDPVINTDLHTYRMAHPEKCNTYDAVISTSVLEHVADDEEFIADCCDLLVRGGYGVFTMDYRDGWTIGQPLPPTDLRLYTVHDLYYRLPAVLESHGCALVDVPDYRAVDRWTYAGIPYSFATFVFKKVK